MLQRTKRPATTSCLRRYLGTDGLYLHGAAQFRSEPKRVLTIALLDSRDDRVVAMGRADQPCHRDGIPAGCGFSIPIPLAWLRHPDPEIRFRFRILENGIEFPKGGRVIPRRKLLGGQQASGEANSRTDVDDALRHLQGVLELVDSLHKPYLLGLHELQRSGAPLIALSIARELAAARGWQPITLCLGPSATLAQDFLNLGPTVSEMGSLLALRPAETMEVLQALRAKTRRGALVNSLCSADLAFFLAEAGFDVLSLVHEYPFAFIPSHIEKMLDSSWQIVFPCREVLEHFSRYPGRGPSLRAVVPQGAYALEARDAARARASGSAPDCLRESLGLPPGVNVVLGCGTVDARKGFDWFMSFVIHFLRHSSLGRQTHFLWLGKVHDHDLFFHGMHGLAATGLSGHFHHLGEREDPTPAFEAADLLLMCSRIDPFPSVVLEAIGTGIPVVGFDHGQGTSTLIAESGFGRVVPALDMEACRKAMESILSDPSFRHSVAERGPGYVRENFQTSRYAGIIASAMSGGTIEQSATPIHRESQVVHPQSPPPETLPADWGSPEWLEEVKQANEQLRAALDTHPEKWNFPWGELRFNSPETVIPQIEDILLAGRYRFICGNPAPRIIDGGGNLGIAAMAFRRDHPHARISVFEADPELAKICQANLAAAGIANVDVRAEALWDHTGPGRFSASGDDRGHLDDNGSISINTVDIASAVADGVDLLKLDIEGAELTCLERLINTGAIKKVRGILAELHLDRSNNVRMLAALQKLGELGFQMAFQSSMADWLGHESSPAPFPGVDKKKTFVQFHAWQEASPPTTPSL